VLEINPASIAAIKGPFNKWLGGIGSEPNVHFYRQDGRSFAHSSRGHNYDLIQISGADTKQALVSGALTLNENYLYTVEAFDDYLKSLAPNGVLSIIRFGEFEALRLANIAVSALRRLGTKEPHRHIAILQSGFVYGVIVHRNGFPTKDIGALNKHLKPVSTLDKPIFYAIDDPVNRPVKVAYTRVTKKKNIFNKYFASVKVGNEESFRNGYSFEIAPPTDHRPFFFDISRYDKTETWTSSVHVVMLRDLLISLTALSLLLILIPVWRMREKLNGMTAVIAPIFFGSIGLAYLMIEVWMLNRFSLFLGHQTYSFIIVLSTLLISTGLGAWQGERLIPNYKIRAVVGCGLVVALLVLGSFLLPRVIESAWNSSLMVRAIATIAFVAPTGMVMGLPFPAGLTWIGIKYSKTVPWCVGINGFASVLSTIVIIPISLLFGYSAVLLTGGGLYAIAGIASMAMREK
jgi:hypothetical protein